MENAATNSQGRSSVLNELSQRVGDCFKGNAGLRVTFA
jgi:hypothetical protein